MCDVNDKSEISLHVDELQKRVTELEGAITERKKVEEALSREKERAETYLNLAGVIMVAIDSHGIVTMINRKGCEILGYDEADVLGKDWFQNFVPERIARIVKPVSEQLLRGEIEPIEFFENPVLTRSGKERLIAWHNSIIRNEAGGIIGTLSSGEDITEREKLQAQLDTGPEDGVHRTAGRGRGPRLQQHVGGHPRTC